MTDYQELADLFKKKIALIDFCEDHGIEVPADGDQFAFLAAEHLPTYKALYQKDPHKKGPRAWKEDPEGWSKSIHLYLLCEVLIASNNTRETTFEKLNGQYHLGEKAIEARYDQINKGAFGKLFKETIKRTPMHRVDLAQALLEDLEPLLAPRPT